jgi:bla regulator protein BlaR1
MIGDLASHLWQSTVFAVIAGLLAEALRKNRAHVRYWLWFAASCKFLVPFSILMNLGSRLGWTLAPYESTGLRGSSVSFEIERIVHPFGAAFPSATATPQTGADWAPVITLVVWICGFAAIALMRLRCWRRIQAAVRISTPLTIPGVGLQASVQVRSSPGLLEPGIVGLWRPVLLLPKGIEELLTPAQLHPVMAHELCHLRRGDNFTASIHMIVEASFWFHPVVWWIGARLVDERERACDEHVLQVFKEPQAYAEGILNICKLYVESPLACVSGVTGSSVKKRIEDIMINRIGLRLSAARKAALALTATLAVAAPIVAGIITAPVRAQTRQRTSDPSAFIRTKETVLQYALFQMRDAIDRYYADQNRYPTSLDLLVSEGYITQIPTDPFTNRVDSWQILPAEREASNRTSQTGIHDVRSGSDATAMDGTKYSEW